MVSETAVCSAEPVLTCLCDTLYLSAAVSPPCPAGCIPTFIDRYASYDYHAVFQPWKAKLMEVQWRKGRELPFIWTRNMSDFLKLYDELFFTGPSGLAKLDLMQQETIEWGVAAKRHFKNIYENAVCSFNITASS